MSDILINPGISLPSPPPTNNLKEKVFTGVGVAQTVSDVASVALYGIRFLNDVAKKMIKLPVELDEGIKATKYFDVTRVFFSLFNVYKDIDSLITKKGRSAKVEAACDLLLHLKGLVGNVAFVYRMVNEAKEIPAQALNWIPMCNIIGFFVALTSLIVEAVPLMASSKLVHDLNKILKEVSLTTDPTQKAQILGDFLQKLPPEEIEDLFEKLKISMDVTDQNGAPVSARIQVLANSLFHKSTDVVEAEHIVRSLRQRAKVELGFRAAGYANKIIVTVGAGFSAFAPFLPVGQFIVLGTGAISFILTTSKFLFISKNPFVIEGPQSETKAAQFMRKIKNGTFPG
jgi:hypothetical protein